MISQFFFKQISTDLHNCISKNFQTVECISMISHFTQFFILISGGFLSFETTVAVWHTLVILDEDDKDGR